MIIKKHHKQQKKSSAQIQNEWKKIQTLDIRSKHKAMRTLFHDIYTSYKKEAVNVEQLKFYIKVVKQIIQAPNFPDQALRFHSKLIADWLNLTGNKNVEIISKITGKIPVETATIAIADPSYFDIDEVRKDYAYQNYPQLINQGKFFIFGTGADGTYNVQLRVVDALEPVLTQKEFRYVKDSTESVIIHIPSGFITVADPCFLDNEKYYLSTRITPGNYKICVYLFHIPKKIQSFYIILCRTDKETNNQLSKIHEFGVSI